MAGWSARSVSRFIKCAECKEAMFDTEPFDANIGRLTLLKQRGGLLYPSRSVYRVAFLAYQAVQQELLKTDGKPPVDPLLFLRMESKIFAAAAEDRFVFAGLRTHDAGSILDAHLPKVVKGVASKIIRAFLGHILHTPTMTALYVLNCLNYVFIVCIIFMFYFVYVLLSSIRYLPFPSLAAAITSIMLRHSRQSIILNLSFNCWCCNL